MGWIKERIDAEYRKYKNMKDMDWSRMAEMKILAQLKEQEKKQCC